MSGATDNGAMTSHVPRFPFSLDPLMAEAKRRMRKRRALILVLTVVIGGGAAGATVALSQSNGFKAAAPCPGVTRDFVYAVPSYPAQAPPAPAWPPGQGGNYWGWMPRSHALTVGDWVHVDTGGVWTVTGIAAMPGDCDPFAEPLGTVVGRLVLGPIKRR